MTEQDKLEGSIPETANTDSSIPDLQRKLRENLIAEFGEKLTELEPLAWREFGLAFGVKAADAADIFTRLKEGEAFSFDMLVDLTCVDWLDKRENRFEVIYQLLSVKLGHRLCIKTEVDEDNPVVPSIRPLWASANFMEREAFDMFGVRFEGHGDLRRILLYDEFVGHPLRKDYPKRAKQPRVELRIPELRNTSQDMRREQLVSLPVRQRLPKI